MPLRVLQVIEATTAGVKRHVLSLVRALDTERFHVTVACPSVRSHAYGDDSFSSELRASGIPFVVIPMQRALQPLTDARSVCCLGRLLLDEPFDVIHLHSSKAGFLGRVAVATYGISIPVLYTPNAFAFQGKGRWTRRPYIWAERFLSHWTTMLICVSQGERQVALAERLIPSQRLTVIENAIAPGPEPNSTERIAARRALRLPDEAPVVGAVGRLSEQKGIRYLLAAAPHILEGMPDTHFVLLGDGEERQRLETQAAALGISERVHFTGYRDDAANLIATFDCLALPSLWEGLSYALLEAYAAGVPVVATHIPGMEIVEEGDSGLIVPPRNPDALAQAILLLLGDASLRRRMGRAGRELVCTRFHLDQRIRKLERLYEMVALRKPYTSTMESEGQVTIHPTTAQVREGRR